MNFKITIFKTFFSSFIAIIAAGLSYGFYNNCRGSGTCGNHPMIAGIIAFIIVFGVLYTLGSLTQK